MRKERFRVFRKAKERETERERKREVGGERQRAKDFQYWMLMEYQK